MTSNVLENVITYPCPDSVWVEKNYYIQKIFVEVIIHPHLKLYVVISNWI